MKKNKFWILFGLAILLSLSSQLFAQANRILTLAPTAQVSSIGNVMLPMMNPARNLFDKDHFSFSRVNWMTNIVNDMSYNFIAFGIPTEKYGNLSVNFIYLKSGEHIITDLNNKETGKFETSDQALTVTYANKIQKDIYYGLNVKLFKTKFY